MRRSVKNSLAPESTGEVGRSAAPPLTFHIAYPSGKRLRVRGRALLVIDLGFGFGIAPAVEGNELFIADPRAVIRVDGQVVYSPRDYPLDFFDPEFIGWLVAHSTWGRREVA